MIWLFLFIPVFCIFYVMYLMLKAIVIVVIAILVSIYRWMIDSHAARMN
jgi:hypothetical protein